MIIAVYPNGRSIAMGTHLSIYVNVIRGEFDDQLEWPCDGVVTVEAWEQRTYQWTNRRRIPLSTISEPEYVQKPVNFRRNRGTGIPEYIDHSELPDFYKENDFCWYSDPFYSHPGGYKMIIAVYPNGRGTEMGTHLSIFVNIIRGEFDDQLEWPCNVVVTIEALGTENIPVDK